MKKKKIILIIIMVLIVIWMGYNYMENIKMKEEIYIELLAKKYVRQNTAIPKADASIKDKREFSPYDEVNQASLYMNLINYEMDNIEGGDSEIDKIEFEDIEAYLSNEFNEDGSYRIWSGNEEIHAFIDWYIGGGDRRIEACWGDVELAVSDYFMLDLQGVFIPSRRLSLEQLKEFMKVINEEIELEDINHELMGVEVE